MFKYKVAIETKTDVMCFVQIAESLAAKGKFEEFCKEFSYSDIIFTSAEKNIGIDTLLDRFEKELAE